MALSENQIERYSRQIVLRDVGGRGQERLLQSTVTVAGDGDMALWALQYLVAGGIGHIDWYTNAAAEQVEIHRSDLADLNPDAQVHARQWPPLSATHADAWAPADVLVAASLTASRLQQVNLWALRARIPLLVGVPIAHGGRVGCFSGHKREQPCALCAGADTIEPAAHDSPLAPPTEALIGSLLALEVITLCLGLEAASAGRWLQYFADDSTIAPHTVSQRPDCAACAAAATDA